MSSIKKKEVLGSKIYSDLRRSKMGYKFDSLDDVWQVDGSEKIFLGSLLEPDNSEASLGLRKALAYFAEEVAGATVARVVSYMRKYKKINGDLNITVAGIMKFKNFGYRGDIDLGHLRAFFISWFDWGFPGIEKDVEKFLDELTLRGAEKGKAVKRRCPYSGPLTKLEQGALVEWSSNALTRNEITLRQCALLMTLMLTGRRLVQVRSLRVEDLFSREDEVGNNYILRVPRVKQKRGGFRTDFRSMPVEEDVYLLLENLGMVVRHEVEAAVGCKLSPEVAKQLPIFVNDSRIHEFRSVSELQRVLSVMPDYLHITSRQSTHEIHNISVACQAKSERTGDFIHINSRRFRYTKGTNLVGRGITGTALAYALDHTDTQNASVYTENTAANAQYIDEIMSPVLAPLAQAFAGKLIDSERDAHRANDPHSRIRNNRSNGVGNCGTYAFCASGYRACYTCTNFQPWIAAPHYEVKEEVLAERERQRKLDISPAVIGATDRLLLAVEEVIRLCSEAKKQEVIDG